MEIRPEDPAGNWTVIERGANNEVMEVWTSLRAAYAGNDQAKFDEASARLLAQLAQLPAKYRPPPEHIQTEIRYNQLRPYRLAWIIMACSAVLAGLTLLIDRRGFHLASFTVALAGFSMLSYGMYMRWIIAGRIPAANMFESLLFISWGGGAFAVIAFWLFRQRSIPFTASAIGAIALAAADLAPLDPFVRPIPPVLCDTAWMSIHVPVIMISYSVLAFGCWSLTYRSLRSR